MSARQDDSQPSAVGALLGGLQATQVTRQIVNLAAAAGLNPHLDPAGTRRGRYRVIVDSGGRHDCLFGVIDVGAGTGRILRAYLIHGSTGVERRYDTVAGIRTVIKSWAALHAGRRTPPR
jgi:hypothetical protein